MLALKVRKRQAFGAVHTTLGTADVPLDTLDCSLSIHHRSSLAVEVHLATALLGDGREREGNPPNILGNALQREYQRAVGAIRANGFAVDAAELLGCAAGIFFGLKKLLPPSSEGDAP